MVVVLQSLAQDEKPVDAAPVTVAFYNLQNYLAMDRRVDGNLILDSPKPEKEIKALIGGIVAIQPDILGVCEMGDPSYLADFRSRLRAQGLDYPHTELVRAKSGFDRNVALLSRFPIASKNSRDDYTYRIKDERLPFQRGVLDVVIQVNASYQLRCIVLHLKSKREVLEADEKEMRMQEAQLARAHLDEIFKIDPEVNLVVMGDLNEDRHEPPIKTLQGFFGSRGYLSPVLLEDPFGFRWTHYWSMADAYSRFDYVFASRGIIGEIDRKNCRIHHWPEWNHASDHRPIVISVIPVNREVKK